MKWLWLWQRPMPWQRLRSIPMKWQKLRPRQRPMAWPMPWQILRPIPIPRYIPRPMKWPMPWLWQRPSHRKWLKIFCGRCGTQAISLTFSKGKKHPTLWVSCAVSHWFCSRIKKSEKKVKKITTLILGGYNEHIERKKEKKYSLEALQVDSLP